MSLTEALCVFRELRGDSQVVVTSMGSTREWPALSSHPLDFHFLPSTMSGAVPLALGLALAQPQREVLVFTGDGSLLMSLGCLATVAAADAKNLTIALLDNGVYEITGGQKTAGAAAEVNFAGFAQAAGFGNVAHFASLGDLRARLCRVLVAPGPRFLWLEVAAESSGFAVSPPCPMSEQIARLRHALA